MTRSPIVVIGIGNPYRRDDGLGPAVVHQLRADRFTAAELVESDGEAATLIDHWQNRRLAVLIDAVHVVAPSPGRIHRLDLPLGGAHPASSHNVDLGLAVRLARELDRLPQRMLVFAVEAVETGYGLGLSPAVARSVEEIASELRELAKSGGQ